MHRGQLPTWRCRHVRVDGLKRPSGRNASPSGNNTPSTIMSPAHHNDRVADRDKPGRPRAQSHPSVAPPPAPVKRSALGPPGRPQRGLTEHRRQRTTTTTSGTLTGDPPTSTTATKTSGGHLTRGACTDKRKPRGVLCGAADKQRPRRPARGRVIEAQRRHGLPAVCLRLCGFVLGLCEIAQPSELASAGVEHCARPLDEIGDRRALLRRRRQLELTADQLVA